MSQELPEIHLESDNLYREESFTDRRVGTLQRLTPVTATGEDDPSRSQIFTGSTQLMTPMGALPLNFEIEASTLEEALDGYNAAAQQAMVKTLEELQEMQREQASGLVVPGQEGGGGPASGGGGLSGFQM